MVKRIRLSIAGTGVLALVLGAAVFAGTSNSHGLAKTAALPEHADGLVAAAGAQDGHRRASARASNAPATAKRLLFTSRSSR